jgi:hypothetical protein
MAPGNTEQMVHYEDTIKKKVSQERIFRYISLDLRNRVTKVFQNKPIAVWGSRDSKANRAHFEKMQPGDDILIVEGKNIKLLGKVAAKTVNHDLSAELWKDLKGKRTEGWDLIYFIANPYEIELPFREFKMLIGYSENLALRGFTSVSEDRLEKFYSVYDDLYSVLYKIKHEGVAAVKPVVSEQPFLFDEDEIPEGTPVEGTVEDEVSDHVRMQWKLLQLGLKAGSTVWIPRNDQSKIMGKYGYRDFVQEFTAGIDTPAKFVENIDVVWKEEFRIDAAFEIENSTSIYSGLLRFSDLEVVAPNSNYPMFIVAPRSRKGRLLEQIKRPTFRKIDFQKKVRYLSYETIDEIENFFAGASSGLSVDLLAGKSERLDAA